AIPCINAGDPENAIADMNDMGKMYYEDPTDDAFDWGAVYNAAMALAMLPNATVESVIEGALDYATPEIEEEIKFVLSITEKYKDPMNRDLWQELTDVYLDPESRYFAHDRIEKYINSSIYENVSYAFALFKATGGDVKKSVIIASNRGYDTDCTAASAGALCGAFSGTKTIPEEWITILDSGIAENPYTNAHFTNKATADGLYRALQNKLINMNQIISSDKTLGKKEKNYIKDYIMTMKKAGVDF
ncbi:MAG: ADP-ribosylglycohydrolase family protein, partial [Draconibacterium sp.]|nr:ADP-ribosylglycohydrolase family protein [Draconibacterium sp.]